MVLAPMQLGVTVPDKPGHEAYLLKYPLKWGDDLMSEMANVRQQVLSRFYCGQSNTCPVTQPLDNTLSAK